MKKYFAWVVMCFLTLAMCACSRGQVAINSESSNISETAFVSPEPTEILIYSQNFPYSTLDELVKNGDIIIVGTVEKALPVVRIDMVELGLVEGVTEHYCNVSPYQIKIIQILKGDFSEGDTIRVDRHGGLAEGINEIYEGRTELVEGSTYLMFIRKTEATEENIYYMYIFIGSCDGFSEIVDGKIFPREYSQVFIEGTPIEEVLNRVSVAVADESTATMESADTAQLESR